MGENIIKIGHSLFGCCTLFFAFLTLVLGFAKLYWPAFNAFSIFLTIVAMIGVVSSAVVTAIRRLFSR